MDTATPALDTPGRAAMIFRIPDQEAEARTLGVLIDFDNFSPPADAINPSAIRHRLIECIRSALESHGGASTIRVRLYGGWMDDGLLSRRGSEVASVLPALDPFPISRERSVIRGSLDLATSLLDDPTVFADTYRRRGSIPRVRLTGTPLPDGCAEARDTCPARILKQFTQSGKRLCPVAACSLTAEDAFVAHEQKMVDTLMSCDLLEMVSDPEYAGVSLVTADTDFVPPLLQAARRGRKTLHLITPMAQWSPQNVALLRARKVRVTELEPLNGR